MVLELEPLLLLELEPLLPFELWAVVVAVAAAAVLLPLDELPSLAALPPDELDDARDEETVTPLPTEALELPLPGSKGAPPSPVPPPSPPRLPLHATVAIRLATARRRAPGKIGEVGGRPRFFTCPLCVRTGQEEGSKIADPPRVYARTERFACSCITLES